MKNNKEKTLKLLLSTFIVITALLVIILVIMIPDDNSAEKQNQDYISEMKLDSVRKTINTPKSQNINNNENKISDLPDYSATTQSIAEEKSEQQKIAIINKRTASKISRKGKKLYFIIDDAGYNTDQLKPFLDFPGSITIAVLPGLPHSEESAELIHKSGKQVFLHQPMEAVGKNNPGPGAIMLDMNDQEIKNTFLNNIKSLPFVSGFNNHMGSAVTSDKNMMEIILKTAQENNIIFTDSFTTAKSKSKEVSDLLGISIAKRDVFLDNVDNREAIMESINTGLNIAENKGHAVMIGHVWSSELANTMMEIYPNLIEDGFTLEEMSDLLLGDM